MDAFVNGALWGAAAVGSGYLCFYVARKRDRAQKGLILALLKERGPLTGMQLKDAGVPAGLIYNSLRDLEVEGLIQSEPLEQRRAERGYHPQRVYWLKEGL